MTKLKWKVSDVPTGRYRSFEKRAWPTAYYPDGSYAGTIYCDDAYIPENVKTGNHGPLTVRLADYGDKSQGAWTSKRILRTFATLKEAKKALQNAIKTYPEIKPKGV